MAKVAVDGTNLDFDGLYDYLIPDFLVSEIKIGYRVLVPFGSGSKKRQGFVFEIFHAEQDPEPKKRYKSVYALCDREPLLTTKSLALARWLSERVFCTLFEAAKAMVPAGLCMDGKQTFAIASGSENADRSRLSDDQLSVLNFLAESGKFIPEEKIYQKTGLAHDSGYLKTLAERGYIISNWEASSKLGGKTMRTVVLNIDDADEKSLLSLTAKQRLVVQTLCDVGSATVSELCYFTGVTASVIFALENKGILTLIDERQYRKPNLFRENGIREEICLTRQQKRCYESLLADLNADQAACSLLFGVTGSGKTSVYMRLIDDAVDRGKSVIMMVPEISLTPQTLSLFYSRYGQKVAVFHSGLSAGERADEWKRVKNAEATIAIGTRSAVFAPFESVGLIIVDEEQEHTYKSERAPRYHAVDVAKYICARDHALLVLASATPSVLSFSYARAGRYKLLTLDQRYGEVSLPEVETVEMTKNDAASLSPRLLSCLEENFKAGHQSILLMNRRGYNTFVACSSCKTVVSCPSCSISLTYHKSNHRLMCHYCGYSAEFVSSCPVCGSETVTYSGCGTQRIETELQELLPDARILRMDADTTMAKNAHEKKLKDFAEKKFDILIGTQMVAKGLDFPDVSLVGVVSADIGLYRDDYRSNERAFDLLTQVIGRAGRRATQGKALIQTIAPDSEIIQYASEQNYVAFYESEIENRRVMIYPPFCDICMIGFISESDAAARSGAATFLALLKDSCKGSYADQKLIVIGPTCSAIHKMGNKYRYKLLIKCRNSTGLRKMIRELLCDFMHDKRYRNVSVFADINPENFF